MAEVKSSGINLKRLITQEEYRVSTLMINAKDSDRRILLSAAMSCLSIAASFADTDPASAKRSIASARRLYRNVRIK